VEDVFRFPRGTEAGHFLHAVLESLDFPDAGGADLAETVRRLLARHGIEPRWEPVVCETLTRVLDTPLDEDGLRLRTLTNGERLNELEFHFPFGLLGPRDLRRALEGFGAYAGAADGLAFESVRGLMKGYIDLVFRHGGRWYVADYKSNHLGDRVEDYGRAALRRAVHAHRYDLQYLIYTLALHRYLGRRLPGYDYERDFGGVYYLFLRGMRPELGPRSGVWHDRPPAALVESLDRLFAR
jgi:exodeoxyribonuclease V beta subunit